MPTYVEYLRSNYASCYFDLTNWIYRTSDKLEIVFKMKAAPNSRNNWPLLCATDFNGFSNGALYVQWNLWNGRECLNIRHGGTYSGDSNFSYNSPYDYTNYYRFTMDGSSFTLSKGATLEEFESIVTATIGYTDDTDTLSIKILDSSKPADMEIYSIKAYRAGLLIHDYAPTTDGLYDKVTETAISSTGTGWTPGPELPPPVPPTPPVGDLEITLQYSASESNKVTKDLTEIATYTGTLRQATSIINPVFTVYCDLVDVVNANYLTVPDFGRSYFINNIRSIREGLVEFTCHVDVLSSFKEELLSNNAIINRSERNWNLYINDGSLKVKQNPLITTQGFPNSFGTDYSFILVIAG